MIWHSPRKPPDSLPARLGSKPLWSRPFWLVEWVFEWFSYGLSHWAFLEVLEYLGSFGVLIAVIFYFSETGDRLKQKHYQAWQVINTAQGKGGNGGRLEALQELNSDGVSLIGVDVAGAFLQGVRLEKARLARANFTAVDARGGDFRGADLSNANLESANFRDGDFRETDLSGTQLREVDFTGVHLAGADFSGAVLDDADLQNADVQGIRWRQIRSIRKANLAGLQHAPDGFLAWAQQNGAVATAHEAD
jgi:hypothetical protein